MKRILLPIAGTFFLSATGFGGIPNYPCYRTVEETYATAQRLADNHPELATWLDIGDSWEKTAGEGGWDLKVLKLTNRNVSTAKPKVFVMSAIHAREYATAELTTRLAESLVQSYGTDPDTTWILDNQEVHFLLVTNPDGRKRAEPQVMWRKNTSRSYCGRNSSNRGVDLNRNFDYQWGGVGSSDQCSETYRGPHAGSEPETQAVQNYVRSLFPDRRGDNTDDAAPIDTDGVFFDIHSYGEIIYQPRGSANDREITTFNRKLAFHNGYRPVLNESTHHPELASGFAQGDYESHLFNHTYSFAYGDLGVASYLIELGTTFFQSCSYFESNILPKNHAALRYALKVARAPYMLPAGPDALDVVIAADKRLTALIDDSRYGNRSGTEPTQIIVAAEYYVDTPPWTTGAVGKPLQAGDGRFGGVREQVSGAIDVAGLAKGRHTVYVRGQDSDGNWGPVTAQWLDVK